MTYTRNGRNHVIDIAERQIDLEEFAEEDLVVDNTPMPEDDEKTDLLDAGDRFAGTDYTADNQTGTGTDDQQTGDETYADNQTQTQQDQQTTEYTQDDENETQTYRETNYAIAVSKGITYRVQVAAGHKLVNEAYFRRRKLKENVQIEIHQGWHKYTVGSHHVYKKARDHRNMIWETTPINDAFVCAYNNGQRITVQEALMIANQKWYK